MINEIAVEPAALSAEGHGRDDILSDLRPHRGRLLVVPSGFKAWANETRKAAKDHGLKDKAYARLSAKLNRLKKNREFLDAQANQPGDKTSWLQQIGNLSDRPVKAYVLSGDESTKTAQAKAVPEECIVEIDDYDRDSHPIAASSTARLPRTNSALLAWAEKLLFLSNHLVLIDRYFDFGLAAQRTLLRELIKRLMQGRPPEKIEVHTYSNRDLDFEWANFQEYGKGPSPPEWPQLTVSHWKGVPEHDRYMFAGPQCAPIVVSYGGGPKEEKGDHTVSYLNFEGSGMKEVYQEYAEDRPANAELAARFTLNNGIARRLK